MNKNLQIKCYSRRLILLIPHTCSSVILEKTDRTGGTGQGGTTNYQVGIHHRRLSAQMMITKYETPTEVWLQSVCIPPTAKHQHYYIGNNSNEVSTKAVASYFVRMHSKSLKKIGTVQILGVAPLTLD